MKITHNKAFTIKAGEVVEKQVRRPDLKFKIDQMWGKRSWLDRLFARRTATMILNAPGSTYQFGGYTGAKRLAYEMVDADKFQMMHWILREAGYECCPADVMKRCGVDPDKRDL